MRSITADCVKQRAIRVTPVHVHRWLAASVKCGDFQHGTTLLLTPREGWAGDALIAYVAHHLYWRISLRTRRPQSDKLIFHNSDLQKEHEQKYSQPCVIWRNPTFNLPYFVCVFILSMFKNSILTIPAALVMAQPEPRQHQNDECPLSATHRDSFHLKNRPVFFEIPIKKIVA